jgi:hypothetical protein
MATSSGHVRRADTDPDYLRFRVNRSRIDEWEDGRRELERPGTFEWWYFEIRISSAALVIAFLDKPMTDSGGGLQPLVSVRAHMLDGLHGAERHFPAAQFSASAKRCDVTIGVNTCRDSGASVYELKFDAAGIKGTVRLEATTPPARIGTGHLLFEDGAANQYLGWIVGVPSGKAEVDCTIDGYALKGTGSGYHDHNWGDRPLGSALHHWYWGRAEVGDFTLIFANMTPQPAFGSSDMAEVVLFEGGRQITCGAQGVTFVAAPPTIDADTQIPMSRVLNIVIDTGSIRCTVTLASVWKLIRLPQGQAAYHRDLALCTMIVERDGKVQVFGPAITSFEMVWFGDADEDDAMDVFQRGLTKAAIDSEQLLRQPAAMPFHLLPASR